MALDLNHPQKSTKAYKIQRHKNLIELLIDNDFEQYGIEYQRKDIFFLKEI